MNTRFTMLCVACAIASSGASASRDPDEARRAIRAVLDSQVAAWNRGDIDGFMEGYWRSDDLTFSAAGKTTRGWNATLGRYKSRYKTREQMGLLDFSDLDIRPLCDDAALVLGRWRLRRAADVPAGNFSLVFTRHNGRWVIVHD